MISRSIPPCPICGAERVMAFTLLLLGQHQVAYHRCLTCGLLQTESPWWLAEAYSRAIAVLDTGLVKRNLEMATKLPRLLSRVCNPHGRFIDLAGGTGLLTRLMRDAGFDFRWHDPHCENIHAPGFEAVLDGEPCEAITAIEVLEHLHDPLAFVREALATHRPGVMVFTTVLHEGEPPPASWWYYLPNTGQHISFYQRRTLEHIAARCGLHLVSHRSLHVMSRKPIAPVLFRFLIGKWGWLVDRRLRRQMISLTRPDLATLERGLIAQQQPPKDAT